MSLWQTVLWNIARAGGFTAFALLTLSVAIGLALTLQWQSPRWPRIINSELHNFITLLALIFTGVHILAVWVDPFTSFSWNEVLIPFVSHYRPLWIAFGIIALYMGIAIGISTWLRPYIGYKWWRRLHVLTLLLYMLVVVHGIATGSDTTTWWGISIYLLSVILVGILLWRRLMKPVNAKSRAHPILAIVVVIAIGVGAFLTIVGPLQPGWNAIANNGNGSGASSVALATTSSQSGVANKSNNSGGAVISQQNSTFPQSFTGDLQGQVTRTAPDDNGNVTTQFNLNISNGPAGSVHVTVQEQVGEDGSMTMTSSQVTLDSSTGQEIYAGSLTDLSGRRRWNMTALLKGTGQNSNSQLQVQMNVRFDPQSGQANGTIRAGDAISDDDDN
jgi:DMSO/TMAO reductase YedYZ heme-binding membrane subunit